MELADRAARALNLFVNNGPRFGHDSTTYWQSAPAMRTWAAIFPRLFWPVVSKADFDRELPAGRVAGDDDDRYPGGERHAVLAQHHVGKREGVGASGQPALGTAGDHVGDLTQRVNAVLVQRLERGAGQT